MDAHDDFQAGFVSPAEDVDTTPQVHFIYAL
jgi:hypothetical protein